MLAERIGIPTFCKYFSAFGLDCKTGIDLPGETGSVYRSEDNMSVLDLAVYSFGQRYNVTAIQLRLLQTAAHSLPRTSSRL